MQGRLTVTAKLEIKLSKTATRLKHDCDSLENKESISEQELTAIQIESLNVMNA